MQCKSHHRFHCNHSCLISYDKVLPQSLLVCGGVWGSGNSSQEDRLTRDGGPQVPYLKLGSLDPDIGGLVGHNETAQATVAKILDDRTEHQTLSRYGHEA